MFEVIKDNIPGGAAAFAWVQGVQLNDIVLFATLVYVVLQCVVLIKEKLWTKRKPESQQKKKK